MKKFFADLKLSEIFSLVGLILGGMFVFYIVALQSVQSLNQQKMKAPRAYQSFVGSLIETSYRECHEDQRCHANWVGKELPLILKEDAGYSVSDLARIQQDVLYVTSGKARSDVLDQLLPNGFRKELMGSVDENARGSRAANISK